MTFLLPLSNVFLVIGCFFCLTAALGILRFPHIYLRLHASSKALAMGAFWIILSVFIKESGWLIRGKLFLIFIFFVITNPISVHTIARMYYQGKINHDIEGIDHE